MSLPDDTNERRRYPRRLFSDWRRGGRQLPAQLDDLIKLEADVAHALYGERGVAGAPLVSLRARTVRR